MGAVFILMRLFNVLDLLLLLSVKCFGVLFFALLIIFCCAFSFILINYFLWDSKFFEHIKGGVF